MSKRSRDYLIDTFSIMIVCWGLMMVCGRLGWSIENCRVLYAPWLIGGLSPTIAAFWVLRRHEGLSFRGWLKRVFAVRQPWALYVLTLALGAAFILPQCLIAGYEPGAPIWFLPLMIPAMMVGGGLEEAGWRDVLQPELEKRWGFAGATLTVAVIWWLWHLPLFYIPGMTQFGQNYFGFGLNVLGLAFALAALRRVSGGVWLCVLFHSLVNSLSGTFVVHENLYSSIAAAVVLILAAYGVVLAQKRSLWSRRARRETPHIVQKNQERSGEPY